MELGEKYWFGEHRMIVRYIGPVATAKNKEQTWIGVEWDSPDRGKNDGSVTQKDGVVVRYFQCNNGRGSFLKPKKLQKGNLRKGTNLRLTVKERYGLEDIDEKESSLDLLASSFAKIEESDSELAKHYPNIIRVILTRTLISSPSFLPQLSMFWPELVVLHLSKNDFIPSQGDEGLNESLKSEVHTILFPNLRALIMNEVPRGWKLAAHLAAQGSRCIEILELVGSCKGDDFKVPEGDLEEVFPRLKELNIADNGIKEWSSVAAFSRCPALEKLGLHFNELMTGVPTINIRFATVKQLTLHANKIEDVVTFKGLSKAFPSLTSLTYHKNPANSDICASYWIIHHFPQIQHLNNREVSERERQEATTLWKKLGLKSSNADRPNYVLS